MINRAPRFQSATSAASTGRGFSLVELLLAVFILAIGIISVAAIFPAGIAQQVQTKDAIYGPIVAEQAVGMLRSKLSQEDFGTFEQFGLSAGDRYQVAGGVNNQGQRDPEIPSDAWETVPGDWGWMRPSFLIPSGSEFIGPGAALVEIRNPNALDGAIDIFGLRNTRFLAGFSELPEQSGESDGSTFAYTSDLSKWSTNNAFGFYGLSPTNGIVGERILPSADTSSPLFYDEFSQGDPDTNGSREAQLLAGIPFNRARYAIFDPPAPYFEYGQNANGTPGGYEYRLDPARAGRLEPLVTLTQGERAWPLGAETPEYYWDCMFRRYQGRIQVAIFVYRVAFGGAGSRSYTVNACSGPGNPDYGNESPLPARVDFPFTSNGAEVPRWYPDGADVNDPTDDMRIPGTLPQPGDSVTLGLDPYSEGWQAPGQWILDQNGTVHRVLSGRRSTGEGPVRLSQRVPNVARQASNGNVVDENNEFTDTNTAGAVKSIWFIPPETRDGITLIPVFVAVKDL